MAIEAPGAPLVTGLALAAWGAFAVARVRATERRSALPWREIVAAGAIAACAPAIAPDLGTAAARGVACIGLLSAAGADARTGYLFDAVTFPAAVLTAAIALCTGASAQAALGVLLLVGTFGSAVLLSRGTLMGLGDVKAMYALGAAFGPVEGTLAVAVACVCGLTVALANGRARRRAEIAFGPHLAAGAAFALIFGDPLALRIAGGGS